MNTNQYIGVVTLAMNDACGTGLKIKIEKTKLTDRGLIELFTAYYYCKNRDFEVHASQESFFKPSLRIQGGLGLIGLVEYESSKDVN